MNDAYDLAHVRERQQAMRALLRFPLISADGPQRTYFLLIRRHRAWLSRWLTDNPEWRLHVTNHIARLFKRPADHGDGSRPALKPKGGERRPFTRVCYAMFCLMLAALQQAERQTTLGELFAGLQKAAAAEPGLASAGFDIDMHRKEYRDALVNAALKLQSLHVLKRIDGDEKRYLRENQDVLYNISRPALAAVLSVGRGPSTIAATSLDDRLVLLEADLSPDTPEARNRRIRSRLTRILLDDPILYYRDLSSDEMMYMQKQRPKLVREVAQATGLRPEVRAEGIAMVDHTGSPRATDIGLPEEGTLGHATLLLAEFLAGRLKREPDALIGMHELQAFSERMIKQHGNRWRKNLRDPAVAHELALQVLARLAALRLVCWRRGQDTVQPLPAIHRFALPRPHHESHEQEPRRLTRRT